MAAAVAVGSIEVTVSERTRISASSKVDFCLYDCSTWVQSVFFLRAAHGLWNWQSSWHLFDILHYTSKMVLLWKKLNQSEKTYAAIENCIQGVHKLGFRVTLYSKNKMSTLLKYLLWSADNGPSYYHIAEKETLHLLIKCVRTTSLKSQVIIWFCLVSQVGTLIFMLKCPRAVCQELYNTTDCKNWLRNMLCSPQDYCWQLHIIPYIIYDNNYNSFVLLHSIWKGVVCCSCFKATTIRNISKSKPGIQTRDTCLVVYNLYNV